MEPVAGARVAKPAASSTPWQAEPCLRGRPNQPRRSAEASMTQSLARLRVRQALPSASILLWTGISHSTPPSIQNLL